MKRDGYQMLAVKDRASVALYVENLEDATKLYQPIARTLAGSLRLLRA